MIQIKKERLKKILSFLFKYKNVEIELLKSNCQITTDEIKWLLSHNYITEFDDVYSLTYEAYAEFAEEKREERAQGNYENSELKEEFERLTDSAYKLIENIHNYGYRRAYLYLREENDKDDDAVIETLLNALEKIENGG